MSTIDTITTPLVAPEVTLLGPVIINTFYIAPAVHTIRVVDGPVQFRGNMPETLRHVEAINVMRQGTAPSIHEDRHRDPGQESIFGLPKLRYSLDAPYPAEYRPQSLPFVLELQGHGLDLYTRVTETPEWKSKNFGIEVLGAPGNNITYVTDGAICLHGVGEYIHCTAKESIVLMDAPATGKHCSFTSATNGVYAIAMDIGAFNTIDAATEVLAGNTEEYVRIRAGNTATLGNIGAYNTIAAGQGAHYESIDPSSEVTIGGRSQGGLIGF